MERDAQKIGAKVVLKEKFETGSIDFRPILGKLRAGQPDVVYTVSYANEAQLLMKQIKELRIDAKLFTGGAAGFAIPEFIEGAKDAAEYVVSATLWSPQVKYPGAKEFAEKYKANIRDYPSYHGASAYAALFVMKDALDRAKTWNQDGIRDALKATNIKTAFGPVKFAGQGRVPESELHGHARHPGDQGPVRDDLAEAACQRAICLPGPGLERQDKNIPERADNQSFLSLHPPRALPDAFRSCLSILCRIELCPLFSFKYFLQTVIPGLSARRALRPDRDRHDHHHGRDEDHQPRPWRAHDGGHVHRLCAFFRFSHRPLSIRPRRRTRPVSARHRASRNF